MLFLDTFSVCFALRRQQESKPQVCLRRCCSTSMGREEECISGVDRNDPAYDGYCLPSWDRTSCWPLTAANQSATLQCPAFLPQFDPTRTFTRRCEADGTWEVPLPYKQCFIETVEDEPDFTLNATEGQLRFYNWVITGAKTMELVGLFLSWTGLVVALFIFHSFRNLRCHRTKIHQHLFLAFIFRLTLEIILGVNRFNSKTASAQGFSRGNSIQNIFALCKTFEVLREYTRICTFAWMFIEGIYLNTLLSSAVFGTPKFILFYIIGWAVAIPFVVAWAIVMDLTAEPGCWYGHLESIWYWVFIEIPRNLMLAANMFFLFNIIRVLVTKLRESNTSETKQVRKALKAAIVLLPLLGVANLVWLLPQPKPIDDRAYILIYNYLFLFLDAYQGFFVAVLYCFVNAEVRSTLKRKWSAWRNSRQPHHHRGHSVVTTATDIRMSMFDNGHVPTET